MHLGCKAWVGGPRQTLFGDGSYSGNIVQGGVTLQPQASYTWEQKFPLTTTMLSATNLTAYPLNATKLINGVVNDNGFATAIADGRARVVVDVGVGKASAMCKIRRYGWNAAYGNDNWAVMYSDDGLAWTKVADLYRASGAIKTWVQASWDPAVHGSHRFWCTYQDVAITTQTWQGEEEWYEGGTIADAIVITGAATVAPDPTTGSASYSCKNLVLAGATASLTASTNCKGLVGFISGQAEFLNGASALMSGMGKAGNFGNLTPYDLASPTIKRKLNKAKLSARYAKAEGALGGAGYAVTTGKTTGNVGVAAGEMQTGGGASGSRFAQGALATVGDGGQGGPCCGGAASGGVATPASGAASSLPASPYGGPASAAVSTTTDVSISGASGDPVGAVVNSSTGNGNPAPGPGGGILWFITPKATVRSGCVVAADGSRGGNADTTYGVGGSGSGGGNVMFWTKPGGFTNQGTVRAAGGAAGTAGPSGVAGTPGGAGSVNIFQDAA